MSICGDTHGPVNGLGACYYCPQCYNYVFHQGKSETIKCGVCRHEWKKTDCIKK